MPAALLSPTSVETLLIQYYLRHRNVQHRVRYAANNPAEYEKLWR